MSRRVEPGLIPVTDPRRAPLIKIIEGPPRSAALAARRVPMIARILNAETDHTAITAHSPINAPQVVDHGATTREQVDFDEMTAIEVVLVAVIENRGNFRSGPGGPGPAATMRAAAIHPDAAICVVVLGTVVAVEPMVEAHSAPMVYEVVLAAAVAVVAVAEARRAAMPHIAEAHPARIAMTDRSSMAIGAMKAVHDHQARVRLVTAREARVAHAHLVTAQAGQAAHARSVTAEAGLAAHARSVIVQADQAVVHAPSVIGHEDRAAALVRGASTKFRLRRTA